MLTLSLSPSHRSVRPTAIGMVLNADTAFSPYVVTGKLLEVANTILGRGSSSSGPAGRGGRGGARGGRGGGRGGGGFGGSGGPPVATPFTDVELHQLERKLKGAKVRVTHRADRHVFAIVGFGQPAGRHQVSIADRSKKPAKGAPKTTPKEAAQLAAKGEPLPEREKTPVQSTTMTVADYFLKTYKKNVDKALQCVELRGGIFVPIDCLELVHGTVIPPTKLTANQAASMINVSAKPPAERRAAIEAIRKDADFGPTSSAAAWGLEVDAQMLKLTGRVLPPPQVMYHQTSQKAKPSVAFGCVLSLSLSLPLEPLPPSHAADALPRTSSAARGTSRRPSSSSPARPSSTGASSSTRRRTRRRRRPRSSGSSTCS